MINSIYSSNTCQHINKIADTTIFKIMCLALGILLLGGGVASLFLGVNTIVTYALFASGGGALLLPLLQTISQYYRRKTEPEELTSDSESYESQNDCKTEPEELTSDSESYESEEIPSDTELYELSDSNSVIVTKISPSLKIVSPETQLKRYKGLVKSYGENKLEWCDPYKDTLPTIKHRIHLSGDIPTNGTLIWDRLIMIAGPTSDEMIQQMWSMALEYDVKAIVRLGPIKQKYKSYVSYQGISIDVKNLGPKNFFKSTTITSCQISYPEYKQRDIPVYAVEGWEDHSPYDDIEEIFHLIQHIGDFEHIIVHCRGGIGRTGAFAALWFLYQLYKKAEGEIEVDPVEIVKEMRHARSGAVESEEQFQMILDFIEYLNSLKN